VDDPGYLVQTEELRDGVEPALLAAVDNQHA
jgi:hypothetical protein